MRPLALFAFLAILLGCFACTTGSKAPVPANRFYAEGARALSGAEELATRGCSQGAVKSYFKAVELFTLADDQKALAACFNNIGNLYLSEGKSADALHYYRAARAIHTRSGNLEGTVRVLTNMAAAHLAEESPTKTEEHLNQAEELAAKEHFIWPQTLIVRANLKLHSGHAEAALALLLNADDGFKAPEEAFDASLHFALGQSFFALERYEEALDGFSKALDVDRKRGALRLMARDLREMGRSLAAMDRKDEAIWHLERALRISTLLGAATEQKALQELLIDLTGESGDSPSSITGYFIERWTSGESFAAPCN